MGEGSLDSLIVDITQWIAWFAWGLWFTVDMLRRLGVGVKKEEMASVAIFRTAYSKKGMDKMEDIVQLVATYSCFALVAACTGPVAAWIVQYLQQYISSS